MRLIFCLIAGFAVAACQSAPPPVPKSGPLQKVVLAPVTVEALAKELSGAQIARPDWEQAASDQMTDALLGALARSGTKVTMGAPADFEAALARAEAVLPEATATETIPTATGPGHWSLGGLPHSGDTALIVVHKTLRTTAGHQLAEIGLGLAFANPLMPERGDSVTHVALIDGGSGRLQWVSRIEGGDARTPKGAWEIARRIVGDIEGRSP